MDMTKTWERIVTVEREIRKYKYLVHKLEEKNAKMIINKLTKGEQIK